MWVGRHSERKRKKKRRERRSFFLRHSGWSLYVPSVRRSDGVVALDVDVVYIQGPSEQQKKKNNKNACNRDTENRSPVSILVQLRV